MRPRPFLLLLAGLALALMAAGEADAEDEPQFAFDSNKRVFEFGEGMVFSATYVGNGAEYDVSFSVRDELDNVIISDYTGQTNETHTYNLPAGTASAGKYRAILTIVNNDCQDIICDYEYNFITGVSQDLGTPMLTGGENWAAVADEPAEVGDGALSVSWDENGVVTEDTTISILGPDEGYSPSYIEVVIGTSITWTNDDTYSHTVTDTNGEFDSGTIASGDSWELQFDTVGTYTYKCSFHQAMQGTIVVVAAAEANEYARTNYLRVWTADTYLVFWANYSMSDDSTITVSAQRMGYSLDSPETVKLTGNNGFSIVSTFNETAMGDSLKEDSNEEWKMYHVYLDSQELGSNGLDYNPSNDNRYSFVFHVRGFEGFVEIGGVQIIRTLGVGFFIMNEGPVQQEIFPGETKTTTFFVKNIGTVDNILQVTPELKQMGYDTSFWQIHVSASLLNGAPISTSSFAGTTSVPLDADGEARLSMVVEAPAFNWETNEPLSNRTLTLYINPYDTGAQAALDEPLSTSLFIRPPQFSLTGIELNRMAVQEGDDAGITIRARAVNHGNYAKDVQVYFLVYDPKDGDLYNDWSIGTTRATQIGSTIIPKMEPKRVLEAADKSPSYTASFTWTEPYVPEEGADRGNGGDYYDVQVFAWINPDQNEDDVGVIRPCDRNGPCDEYNNKKDDNLISIEVSVVADTALSFGRDCYVFTNFLQKFGDNPSNSAADSPSLPSTEMCEEVPANIPTVSTTAFKTSGNVWIVTIVNADPQISVGYVYWYLLDIQGNTVSDGLVSAVYGYYAGEGKGVIFIDYDFDGKLSPGDKFEVHPGESGSDLENTNSVDDYTVGLHYSIHNPPKATIDSITPSPARIDEKIIFSGTGLQSYGTIVAYQWNSSIDGELSTETDFSTSELSLGHHTITFRVQDDNEEWSNADSESLYIGIPPVAIAGDDATVVPGGNVQFSGAATDDDGSVAKYEWDFDGDGVFEWSSTESGLTTFIYNDKGTYNAVLRVTDNDGFTSTDTRRVHVSSLGIDSVSLFKDNLVYIILLFALIAGFVYWKSRDDYTPPSKSRPVTPPSPTRSAPMFSTSPSMTAIECPGCNALMKVPKLGKMQMVTCDSCGLSGEIEI